MLWNDEICKYVSLLFTGSHKHARHLSKVAYGMKSMTLLEDSRIALDVGSYQVVEVSFMIPYLKVWLFSLIKTWVW